jgi:hypothetical protein
MTESAMNKVERNYKANDDGRKLASSNGKTTMNGNMVKSTFSYRAKKKSGDPRYAFS